MRTYQKSIHEGLELKRESSVKRLDNRDTENLIKIESEISNPSYISSNISSDIADFSNEYSSGVIGFL
jgi:hypothetical protein